MTAPTYGEPLVQPDDIVARIDALIPADEVSSHPLVWRARNIDLALLIDARNEIQGLRSQLDAAYVAARVRMLEEALADEGKIRARLAEANDDLRARLRTSETKIERLRARVAGLEAALRHYADEGYNGHNGNGTCARTALEAKP